jgi:hypothetical protein
LWNFPCFERRPISVPSLADMALARSLRLPIRCHQRMFTSVSPKDVHPVFISPLARRTSEPCTRRGLGELGGRVSYRELWNESGRRLWRRCNGDRGHLAVDAQSNPSSDSSQPGSNRKRSVSKAWCQKQEIVVGLDGPPLGLTVPSGHDEGRLDQYTLIPSGLSCQGHVRKAEGQPVEHPFGRFASIQQRQESSLSGHQYSGTTGVVGPRRAEP